MDLVSVVIPSVGREELGRAVDSVLNQKTADQTQIVIVFDLPQDDSRVPRNLRAQDVVAWTGGGKRGSFARNLGVQQASGDWIAFLDDDDEWIPSKIEAQLAAARELKASGYEPVVSTRHVQFDHQSGRTSAPVPLVPFDGVGPVSSFLFKRRRPGGGRASIYTSTLLTTRALALAVPWDQTLSRHQDWDWLVRADNTTGVRILQLETPGVVVHSGSAGSISASTDWLSSLTWAHARLLDEPKGVYEDFLAAQTLRYAIGARSWTGVRRVVAALIDRRRAPSLGPLIIALAGLIPRGILERLMTRMR